MNNYTPLPFPNSYHIEDYGLHGPEIDGLLMARSIVARRQISDFGEESAILKEIDRQIEEVKALYARQAKW